MSVDDPLVEKEDYIWIAREILIEIEAVKYCITGKHAKRYKHDDGYVYRKATDILKEKYGEEQNFNLWKEAIHDVLLDCLNDECDCLDKD